MAVQPESVLEFAQDRARGEAVFQKLRRSGQRPVRKDATPPGPIYLWSRLAAGREIRTIVCPNRRSLLIDGATGRVRLALRQKRDQLRRIVVLPAIHVAVDVAWNCLSFVILRLRCASRCCEGDTQQRSERGQCASPRQLSPRSALTHAMPRMCSQHRLQVDQSS
jgi:hypothetical protein